MKNYSKDKRIFKDSIRNGKANSYNKLHLNNEAITITFVYCFFGILWIFLSDLLLEALFLEEGIYKTLQTFKGWFYIGVTTVILYLLIRNRVLRLKKEIEKSAKTYEKLKIAHEELVKAETELKFLAFYDQLTGLPNRMMFENEIHKHVNAETDNSHFMVAYLDIDNFKNINDSMGHQVGDTFLKYIADCLKAEVEEPNFIARMGGDEFVIIYFNISKEHLLENIEKIRDHISRSWSIQNHQFYVSMSVGVVMYPRDGDNLTELMKHSDIAMNTAKREGRNRILFYEEDIKEINSWHVRMINNLQYAISEEQFILYYQPQFKLDTGEITGMEALVRWVHPEDGAIAPSVFIPLAEETGQIYSLERWIVAKALEQKKIWEDNGFHEIVLSINLSGKTLTSEMNFVELEHILSVASVDYSKIVIEITETANISDVDIVIGHLERLKRLGLRVALDDFGTGFSSLIYMKKFPIDIIKLDKSFIHSIQEGGIDTLLIKNIIYLAHDLKYEVVAEGIESKEQLDYLRQYYCESGQGYLLSRPLPKENIDALLNNNFHFKD